MPTQNYPFSTLFSIILVLCTPLISSATITINSCPNVTVSTGPFSCDAFVTYTVDFTTDCGPVDIATSPNHPSASVFPFGTTTFTITLTNSCGDMEQCQATVTVTDGIAPVAICDDDLQISLGGGMAMVTATELDEGSWDNCDLTPDIAISRDGGTPSNAVTFDCSDVGNLVTLTLTVTDQAGNTNQCFHDVEVMDPNGFCPTGDFLNEMTGEYFLSIQEAVDAAADGSTIRITTEDNVGDLSIPDDKTITITADDGTTVTIDDLTIGESSVVILSGNFAAVIATVRNIILDTATTGSEFNINNTGNTTVNVLEFAGTVRVAEDASFDAETAVAPASGFTRLYGTLNANLVDVISGFFVLEAGSLIRAQNISGGYPGGGFIGVPNTKIRRDSADQGAFEIAAGTGAEGPIFIPFGLFDLETDEEYYTPIVADGVVQGPDRIRVSAGGPGSVDELFSPEDAAPGVAGPPANGISFDFVDMAWDVSHVDAAGEPIDDPLDLSFYFPTMLQTGASVMENPVVVNAHEEEDIFFLGEPTEGAIVADGLEFANSGYNKIVADGVNTFSPFAIFGCPGCGEGMVQICQPSPAHPDATVTRCIPKSELIEQLENGSYCGPCRLTAAPDGINCTAGSTGTFDPETETYTLTSEGCYAPGYYSTTDAYGFIGSTLCDDGEIIAEVTDVAGNGWAGIIMRDGTTASDRMIQLSIDGANLTKREMRVSPGSPAFAHQFLTQGKTWLRLTRQGSQFAAFHSVDGINWGTVAIVSIPMNSCIDVGLISENASPSGSVTGTFANVVINDTEGSGSSMPLQAPAVTAPVPESQVQVYPNPVSELLTIAFPTETTAPQQLRLVDVNGRTVRELSLDAGAWTAELNGKGLPAGVYVLQVPGDKENLSFKIMVE